MNDNGKWWTEFALDVIATFLIGWLLVGGIAAGIISATMVKGEDPGDLVKFLPVLVQGAVTYGFWKLFRTFNWLKGVPPKRV